MFNLTPRFEKTIKTNTPPNVAPNSYVICNERHTRENIVPFMSNTERKFKFVRTLYTHAMYNPDELKPHIKGGSSIRNTSQRTTCKGDYYPGPCDYDSNVEDKKKKQTSPVRGRGRLYVCRVPYSIYACGPSIPTHFDENGYDLDKNGIPVKMPANVYDTTRGPAFYHVPTEEICFTTKKYHKGWEWSKSKTKRTGIKPREGPAPGDYDAIYEPCRLCDQYEEYRQLARLFTFIPRFTEAQMLNAAREDLPGPGQYDVDISSFRSVKTMSIKPRPFVMGAKRFKYHSGLQIPGPGKYEICNCSTAQKQFSIKKIPFGTQTARFKSRKRENVPGPGNYNVIGFIEEKLRSKTNKYSAIDVPFGGTAERKMAFISERTGLFPGPGQYDVMIDEVKEEDVSGAVFKSKTGRFKKIDRMEDVGPASYNITESFNKNRGRNSHNTGKVPFQSSQPRSSSERSTKTPGPGDYAISETLGLKGSKFSKDVRFKYVNNELPGPGAYTLHPSVALSMYKGIETHNLRLKENVMRTKMRLPPGATWQNWVAQMKKKKKLRCFSKPTVEYEHYVAVM